MSKPSIFSKDYKTRMRKRRRKISIVCILIVVLGVAAIFFVKNNNSIDINNIKNKVTSILKKKNVNNDKKNIKNTDTKKNVNAIIDDQKDEKSYSIKLADGAELKAIYEEVNGAKDFKSLNAVVDGDGSKFKYDISPNTTKIIIFDIKAQSIIYLNNDGSVNDITNKAYVSESSGTRFSKESVLSSNPNYIWASSPRFVDNDNVAYISQLPWFNKENMKYLWIVNVNKFDYHRLYENVQGINLSFDKLVDKGLTIKIDENTKYLKADGTLSD